MTEYRLFTEDVPYVSTAQFHAGRERAPHLEQVHHRPRLEKAADFARQAVYELHADALRSGGPDGWVTVSDLGCGDGGLLSLLKGMPNQLHWGYDFQPSNEAGWRERGVDAELLDVFGAGRSDAALGEVSVMTEVLEHVADPADVLRWVRAGSKRLICSSPWNENDLTNCPEHAWAWDMDGYAALLRRAGWKIQRHEQVGLFQVVLAK